MAHIRRSATLRLAQILMLGLEFRSDFCIIIIIIIIIYPLRHEAHRSRTKVLHFSLFLANFSSFFQDFPIALNSCSVDLRQVALGLPLFLFPWGFHFSACLVTLSSGLRSV